MRLFGFEISRAKQPDLPAFALPENVDGAHEATSAGGAFASYLNLEGSAKNEADLILKYRDMLQHPECDLAVENIIQEAIITNQSQSPVTLDLTETKLSSSIQNKFVDEFDFLLTLLDFKNSAYDIFRRWYTEGRLYYHIMIDPNDIGAGIQELRALDSMKIKKIRELKSKEKSKSSKFYLPEFNEYFVYNEQGLHNNASQGIKIANDSIIHVNSGLMNSNRTQILSYLHKAIKPLNQLVMLEDAVVIYRIARAPERRIFYIDVGNLPKVKAEQYLRDIMTRYKNKLVYDAATGDVQDNRRHQSMMEDYWLPRREGGRGTEITTLPGGQNLGEMEDVEYFKKKLYQAMNVPLSRLEADTPFQLGRASEISRDELKFSRFIDKIRTKFSSLFLQVLEKQVVLKNITTIEEFSEFKHKIKFDFAKDNHFTELKEAELLQDRLNILRDMEEYTGKYYSKEYIRRNVLRQTDDDIKRIDKEIEAEKATDTDSDGDGIDDRDFGGGGFDFQSKDKPQEPEVEPSEPQYLTTNKFLKLEKVG